MTVGYGDRCQTVKNIGNFWRMLFLWKGSVYKLVWLDLLIFLTLYYGLSICYNYLLVGKLQELFMILCDYCETQMVLIPLSFVLGFYVSNVISRWEKQFLELPTIDNIAIFVTASIPGKDEKSRLMRRSIVRYLNLSFIMLMISMCPTVKKRFPTLEHLVSAGMLFESEHNSLNYIQEKIPSQNIYWVPLVWASNVVIKARKQNKIIHDIYVRSILSRICDLRKACNTLVLYRSVPIPLVYTQVATIVVYTFFLAVVFGRQVLPTDTMPHPIDLYFPIFTVMEFLIYMGWLKVAETFVNPYGEDDDDFEINWLVDRNIQLSYGIVDEVHERVPDLVRDQYWDQVIPDNLPHTPESKKRDDKTEYPDESLSSVRMHLAPSKSMSKRLHLQQVLQERVSKAALNRTTETHFAFMTYPRVEDFWRKWFTKKDQREETEIVPSMFEKREARKRQSRSPFTDRTDPNMVNALLSVFPLDFDEGIVDEEQCQTSGFGRFEGKDATAVTTEFELSDLEDDNTGSDFTQNDFP